MSGPMLGNIPISENTYRWLLARHIRDIWDGRIAAFEQALDECERQLQEAKGRYIDQQEWIKANGESRRRVEADLERRLDEVREWRSLPPSDRLFGDLNKILKRER